MTPGILFINSLQNIYCLSVVNVFTFYPFVQFKKHCFSFVCFLLYLKSLFSYSYLLIHPTILLFTTAGHRCNIPD